MRTGYLLCCLAVIVCTSPAEAQDFSIGVGAGFVKPEDVDASPLIMGTIRVQALPWLVVEPEVSYWRNTSDEDGCIPDLEVCFGTEARISDLTTGVNVLLIRSSGRVRPWGAVGIGAHFLETEVTFDDLGQTGSTSQTEFGTHLLGGVDVNLTDRLVWYAAGRYDTVIDQDIQQFKAYGEIRFAF